MCRSSAEGGRRCDGDHCPQGKREYKKKLANYNRAMSRAQRSYLMSSAKEYMGDTPECRDLIEHIKEMPPRNIPAMVAYMESLDPEFAHKLRGGLITAGNERKRPYLIDHGDGTYSVGYETPTGRHMPGVHNQQTMNDRSTVIKGDHYDTYVRGAGDQLCDRSDSLMRSIKDNNRLTAAFVNSPKGQLLPEDEREKLLEAAGVTDAILSHVGRSGSSRVDVNNLTPDQKYSLHRMTPEDISRVSYVEEGIAGAQRREFLRNCEVQATVRPVLSPLSRDGYEINDTTRVSDVMRYMEENDIDSMAVREGVVLTRDEVPTVDEPIFTYEVEGGLGGGVSLPVNPSQGILAQTARIPMIHDFRATPGTEMDGQHMAVERLTSKNTPQGRDFRTALAGDVTRRVFNGATDVGSDMRWEAEKGVDENGETIYTGVENLVPHSMPGKRRALTAEAASNMAIRSITRDGCFTYDTDLMPSTGTLTVMAAGDYETGRTDKDLMDNTGYAPGTHTAAVTKKGNRVYVPEGGRTIHGHDYTKGDPNRTINLNAMTVVSDKSRKEHAYAMRGVEALSERLSWDMQDSFNTDDSAMREVFGDTPTSDADIDRMVKAGNKFRNFRENNVSNLDVTKKQGADALNVTRAVNRGRNTINKKAFDGARDPSVSVTTVKVPKGTNTYNLFSKGRRIELSQDLTASPDGTGIVADGAPDDTEVRVVMCSAQGVPMSKKRSVIPAGSQLRSIGYGRDEDGMPIVFAVDEADVLAAAASAAGN